MMNPSDSEILEVVRRRAEAPETRTDYAARYPAQLAPCATESQIAATQQQLGVDLHPFHVALLRHVGNGGFGPGDGLVGGLGGRCDEDGRTLVELRRAVLEPGHTNAVAICERGDGVWSGMDVRTGQILTIEESGVVETADDVRTWILRWAKGEDLCRTMFVSEYVP